MVHGASADDAAEVASQAAGTEDGTAATLAHAHCGTGGILALGRIGPRPLLRRTHEWPGLACLPPGCRSPVVDGVAPSQPRKPSALAPNDATGHPVASDSSYLPSLSPRATGRPYPRREPDAEMPHVRICGGGHARSLIPTPTRYARHYSVCCANRLNGKQVTATHFAATRLVFTVTISVMAARTNVVRFQKLPAYS